MWCVWFLPCWKSRCFRLSYLAASLGRSPDGVDAVSAPFLLLSAIRGILRRRCGPVSDRCHVLSRDWNKNKERHKTEPPTIPRRRARRSIRFGAKRRVHAAAIVKLFLFLCVCGTIKPCPLGARTPRRQGCRIRDLRAQVAGRNEEAWEPLHEGPFWWREALRCGERA